MNTDSFYENEKLQKIQIDNEKHTSFTIKEEDYNKLKNTFKTPYYVSEKSEKGITLKKINK